MRVARDRRGHRPADGLRILGAEIAGHGEETGFFGRIESGELTSLQPVLLVREDLAHHVDQRPAGRDEQPLLAVGRKAHVAGLERLAMRAGDRLLAEACDVERRLALALREQHARVEGARQHHVAQALAQFVGRERPRPVADRLAPVIEHADHRIGEIADFRRIDVDRRPRDLARLGHADMTEIGPPAGPHAGFGHMQRKASAHLRVPLSRNQKCVL